MYTMMDFTVVLIYFSPLLVKELVHVIQSKPNRKNFPKNLQPVIIEVTRGKGKERGLRKRENRKRQKGVEKTILRRNLPFASTCSSASSWHCGTPPKT